MPQDELPPSPLPGIRCIEITPEYEAALQRFFEANPRYFMSVNGEPANAGDAHKEIHGALPAGWPFTRKWLVGYLDQNGALVAMANIVSDLVARGVWHIGLFIVATSRHGSGDAHALYRSLEAWGLFAWCKVLRLGVVRGNQRAERFWERRGFVDTRTREGVIMGEPYERPPCDDQVHVGWFTRGSDRLPPTLAIQAAATIVLSTGRRHSESDCFNRPSRSTFLRVFRLVAQNGKVAYQDSPCPSGSTIG